MEFEQKAEEKKMSMSKNIARLAVTAGLTAALSFGGVMAPVTMAFAEGATTSDNSITITQNKDNESTTFKAYQIFKADVVDPTEAGATDKIVSNVKWADGVDPDAQNAIIEAIKKDSKYTTSDSKPNIVTAQDVADWLAENVTDTTAEPVVNKDHLLNKIAAIVKKNVEATGNSFSAGDSFTVPKDDKNSPKTGYYLFLTDESSLSTSEVAKKNTGTSPIFAVVGGKAVTVVEKTGIPTVTKKVKDDKPDSDWKDKADSQMGQDVHYQLTGTVADNVATFGTYYYEFHDKLSAGLTANADSVNVTVYADDSDTQGTEIELPADAVSYNPDGINTLLTVKFDNLKAVTAKVTNAPVEITASSKVVVTYTASLDPSKTVTVGDEGNPNSVKLIYSNNPMGDGKGESVADTVRDYTYALRLVKEDAANDVNKLDGVKFTIQATNPDDNAEGAPAGAKYVQENGTLSENKYEFETKNGGVIEVKGLDAGTYTVKETHTLDGYNTLPDFTFRIWTADGDLAKPEGEDNNKLTVKVTRDASSLVKDATVTDGVVNLTVQNKKGSGLPLTGLNGVTFTWIAGGAVLCIGVAHLIRSRKQAEESERE